MLVFEKEARENTRIAEIMGVPRSDSWALGPLFQDQVARDLDIPFHTVRMAEYEEWYRRGFELDPRVLRGALGLRVLSISRCVLLSHRVLLDISSSIVARGKNDRGRFAFYFPYGLEGSVSSWHLVSR